MKFVSLASTMMVLSLMACPVAAQSQHQKKSGETQVQLSEVPEAAMNAAQKELGAAPTGASLEGRTASGQEIYELEAKTPQGEEKAVHVTADGKVVKHEKGKD